MVVDEENFWTKAAGLRPGLAPLLRGEASCPEGFPGLQLARCVDESGHSLADWLDSLALLREWIVLHPRPAPWLLQLGYVSCCSDYARARVGSLPLPEVVRDFLEGYGFEGGSG